MTSGDQIEPRRPGRLPSAWLLSMLIHVTLVVLLGFAIRLVPAGVRDEPVRTAGIVLKRMTPQRAWYEGESRDAQEDRQADVADAPRASPDVVTALPSDPAPADPTDVLPELPEVAGIGRPDSQAGIGTRQLTRSGTRQPTTLHGGTARVRLFGLEGVGRKFIYVFDRSTSMEGSRLSAAKSQLIKSLASLESTHQFQIIFFNHELRIFDLTGGQRRFPFATDAVKQTAARWVASISAAGNTERFEALRKAVAFNPDVIFFLTDDDNPMTAVELDAIRRKNRGRAAIHVIQFGYGHRSGTENFLSRLARQNGGTYAYVDADNLGSW